jgi:hypothetical protein
MQVGTAPVIAPPYHPKVLSEQQTQNGQPGTMTVWMLEAQKDTRAGDVRTRRAVRASHQWQRIIL